MHYASGDTKGTDTIIGSGARNVGYTIATDESLLPELDDVRVAKNVMVDSTTVLGTAFGTTMVRSYMGGDMAFEPEMADQGTKPLHALGQFYGYSECETLGMCESTNFPGSACSSNEPVNPAKGFCYTSSTKSLECGRTIKTWNHWMSPSSMVNTAPGATIHPCPRGSPLTKLGATGTTTTMKRLPIVGCMIATDSKFVASAQLHAPQMCEIKEHFKPGCVFPGALDFDPGAKEPTTCKWQTGGCTDSSAANFDPDATMNDGSCLEKIVGCVIAEASYTGVDPKTPRFEELYVDQKGYVGDGKWQNRVTLPGYKNVKKGVSANGLQYNWMETGDECEIVVEGCTDSNAVNYDPEATLNSHTWCLPKVEGCMIPEAVNWNEKATVPTECSFLRKCDTFKTPFAMGPVSDRSMILPVAAGKNPHTNAQRICWDLTSGCLSPFAMNYGCDESGSAPCVYNDGLTILSSEEITTNGVTGYNFYSKKVSDKGVTVHDDVKCTYPSKAAIKMVTKTLSKLIDANPDVTLPIEVALVFAISLDPCDKPNKIARVLQKIADRMAVKWDVEKSSVKAKLNKQCRRQAANANSRRLNTAQDVSSVRVFMVAGDAAEAKVLATTITLDKANVNAVLAEVVAALQTTDPGLTLEALSTPGVEYSFAGEAYPDDPPPVVYIEYKKKDDNVGAIVGGVIGGILGLLLCIGLAVFLKKKRDAGYKQTAVTPA